MPSLSLRESERWGAVGVLGYRRVVLLLVVLCVLGFAFGFVLRSSSLLVDSFRGSSESSMFASLGR